MTKEEAFQVLAQGAIQHASTDKHIQDITTNAIEIVYTLIYGREPDLYDKLKLAVAGADLLDASREQRIGTP